MSEKSKVKKSWRLTRTLHSLVRLPFQVALSVILVGAVAGVYIAAISTKSVDEAHGFIGFIYKTIWS